MYNPTTAPYADTFAGIIEAATPPFGVTAVRLLVRSGREIEGAVKAFAREANGGLILITDSFLTVYRDRIAALAIENRLPAISNGVAFARSGALIGYGPDAADQFRGAASYVDRVLRGAKASELPVQAPTKYEMVLNLKTAKALGLTIPETLLATADEVIQ
jgi:putative ABC transport system substrate-binding protein